MKINYYKNQILNPNTENIFYKIFKSCLFLSLGFTLLETGVFLKPIQDILPSLSGETILPVGLSIIFLTMAFIIYLIGYFFKDTHNLFDPFMSIKTTFYPIKYILISIAVYLLFDLLSLTYTNYPNLAMTKYFTSITMFITLIMLSSYIVARDKDNKTNVILMIFSIVGITLAVFTIGYWIINGTTFYTRRLSMAVNYNKSAFVVLFGYYSFLYYIFRNKFEDINYLLISIVSLVSLSVIYLSGSRRCFYLLIITMPIIIFICFYQIYNKNKANLANNYMKFVYAGATILATFLLLIGFIGLYTSKTDNEAETLALENPDIADMIASRDITTILNDDKSMDKRSTLWNIAKNDFNNMKEPQKKLIGSGASYHFEVYDLEENKNIIEDAYGRKLGNLDTHPHNFLLVELLDGGYIKVVITMMILLTSLSFIIKIWKISSIDGAFLLIMAFALLSDMFMEVRNGILDYKFLWLMIMLFLSVHYEYIRKKNRKIIVN